MIGNIVDYTNVMLIYNKRINGISINEQEKLTQRIEKLGEWADESVRKIRRYNNNATI